MHNARFICDLLYLFHQGISIGKEVVLPFLRSPDVIDANKDFVDPVFVAFATN